MIIRFDPRMIETPNGKTLDFIIYSLWWASKYPTPPPP